MPVRARAGQPGGLPEPPRATQTLVCITFVPPPPPPLSFLFLALCIAEPALDSQAPVEPSAISKTETCALATIQQSGQPLAWPVSWRQLTVQGERAPAKPTLFGRLLGSLWSGLERKRKRKRPGSGSWPSLGR